VDSWPVLSFVLTLCAVPLLAWAALHDLAARTVPNALPLAILGIGICVRLIDHSVGPALAAASLVFAVLFAFWRAGFVGGGDVKLWSASVMLVPAQWQTEICCFTRVLLAGGLLALLYLALRLVVAKPGASRSGRLITRAIRAEAWRIARKGPLPYAFAIAGGTIVTLLPASFAALR